MIITLPSAGHRGRGHKRIHYLRAAPNSWRDTYNTRGSTGPAAAQPQGCEK